MNEEASPPGDNAWLAYLQRGLDTHVLGVTFIILYPVLVAHILSPLSLLLPDGWTVYGGYPAAQPVLVVCALLPLMVILSIALGAPALGALVRARIDRSPLLMEALLTPLSYRDFSEAVDRQLAVMFRWIGPAVALFFFTQLCFAAFGSDLVRTNALAIPFAIRVSRSAALPYDHRYDSLLIFALVSAIMGASFVLGAHARALALACFPAFEGARREAAWGGLATVALVAWALFFGWFRLRFCMETFEMAVLHIFMIAEGFVLLVRYALVNALHARLHRNLPRQYEQMMELRQG